MECSMFCITNTSICILGPCPRRAAGMRTDRESAVTRTRDRTRKTHAAPARQIVGVTNARQMQRGDPLPEQMFAGLCGVSRTPMRSAFKILEDIGFLESPLGSGYCLALDPESESLRVLQHLDAAEGSLADRILEDRGARRLKSEARGCAIRQFADPPLWNNPADSTKCADSTAAAGNRRTGPGAVMGLQAHSRHAGRRCRQSAIPADP